MGRWYRLLLVLLVVGAAAAALRFTLLAPDPVAVRVAEVGRGRVEETVTNSRAGTVEARRRARMAPEIGGQVVALPHREGERVAAGDLLLELDPRSQRARLALAREEAAAAEAEARRACLAAERAGRELARVRRLAEDEIVSNDLLDEVESNERAAEAACAAARAGAGRAAAAVEVARAELAKTRLVAPFDGVVAEIAAEVGEWVTPSPPALPVPPVIDVLDPSSIHVSAPMDEVDSARVRPGQRTRMTVDSQRDRTFAGEVVRVAPYVLDVQEQNRTVEIEVAFTGGGEPPVELLSGTSADVEVILAVRDDVPWVPTPALLQGDRVLVVGADGRLEERRLEIGLRNWDRAEVLAGLEGGERVVVSLDREEVEAGALVEVE